MTPLVIAHRGACWDEPENTLAAFERAIAVGADYVEFDVRAGRNGALVCAHGRARRTPPAHTPTLDDSLAVMVGRVGLAVEIKEPAATAATLAALDAHDAPLDRVLVLSSHRRVLEDTQRLRPHLRTVLHLRRFRPDPRAAARFWGVGIADRAARAPLIARAGSLGLATTVYTVNDPKRMRELAELGVTGIFTDRPDVLRRTLESR